MSETIDSYATAVLRLWAARKAPHGQQCPCLICADARAYLGEHEIAKAPVPMRRAS